MSDLRLSIGARLRAARGEQGFALIETIVAFTVAALIFTALATVLMGSLGATLSGRQAQQAIDLATRAVETSRDLDYATLGLNSTAGAADTPTISAGKYGVKLSDGTVSSEDVVYVANSPLNPHKLNTTLDGTIFAVAQYVTTPPADTTVGAAYKRLTVVVSWRSGTQTKSRTTSTLVTLQRRGLPQPKFTAAFHGATLAAGATGVTVNRGDQLTVALTVTNRGARDRWDISTVAKDTNNVTRPWQLAWWNDNGAGSCDGVRGADELTRMDPNLDGVADTNTINTDDKVCLVGTYTVPVTESISPAVINLSVTATSNAVSTVSQTQTVKVNLASSTCTPTCTYRTYHLHNFPAEIDTATTNPQPINAAPPTGLVLPKFSSDVDAFAGRFLQRGGDFTDTDPRKVAVFDFATPTACTIRATTAYVQLFGMTNDGNPDSAGAFSVQVLFESAPGVLSVWGSATVTRPVWGYGTFSDVVVPVILTSAQTLPVNRKVEVRVVAPSTATTDMRLAYDTTTYNSVLVLPVAGTC